MFDKNEIIQKMKTEYFANKRPWIVGFSGGKDSTCLLQLTYEMLLSIPKNDRNKHVYVLSSDTLIEAPIVGLRQKRICEMINASAERDDVPLSVNLLSPGISDTFWVNLIGRGYPSPNKWFRWCTERLKIKPMNTYILEHIKENGEVLVLIGARKAESASRSQTLAKHETANVNMRKHTDIKGAFVYTPLEDLSDKDVWGYLDTTPSPWGDDNSKLRELYQKKDDEEVAFILDEKSPPSGHSRFGCWTCTVVEKDRALACLIEEGHPEYKPLMEFRNELKAFRDDPTKREEFRKNQRIDKFFSEYGGLNITKDMHREHEVMGPFTLETRHYFLKRLLEVQKKLRKTIPGVELISPEEICAIQTLWIYDGDTSPTIDGVVNQKDSIEKLIDRMLKVEEDKSELSKRIGIYKKLEQVVMEYTMNKMVVDSKNDCEHVSDDGTIIIGGVNIDNN